MNNIKIIQRAHYYETSGSPTPNMADGRSWVPGFGVEAVISIDGEPFHSRVPDSKEEAEKINAAIDLL